MLMEMVKIEHENFEEVRSRIADGTQGPPDQCLAFVYNSQWVCPIRWSITWWDYFNLESER